MPRSQSWVRTFMATLVVGLAAVSVALIVALNVFSVAGIDKRPEAYGVIVAGVALLFGTAATLAGAVATVKLASATVVVTQETARLEARLFIEERVDGMLDIFSGVAGALSDVSTDALKLSSGDGPTDAEVRGFIAKLKGLQTQLARVPGNRLTSVAYEGNVEHDRSALGVIAGVSEAAAGLSVGELTDLAKIIEMRGEQLEPGLDDPDVHTRVLGAIAGADRVMAEIDARSPLRVLLVAGNLLWMSLDEIDDGIAITAIGAALLHDLYRCIPTGEELTAALVARYPEMRHLPDLTEINFDPREAVGRTFAEGADELWTFREKALYHTVKS